MKKIVFMGTPDFAVPVLQQLVTDGYEVVLVVTQPDRPKGRKRVLTPPPVKDAAVKQGIPVYQPENIKQSYQDILAYQPDLIVTAAFGQILPKPLLDAPPFGCINVHASLLPELRGGAPIHYAIMQGKQETGITIMYMVEALDAGAIISQAAIRIEADDHVGTMHEKLAELGASLLHDTLPGIFSRRIEPLDQVDDQATYAPNISREQEKINWHLSNIEIYNQIRGMHPWPVASTTIAGRNLKLWWAEPINQDCDGQPGQIVKHEADGIVIACGKRSAIKLTDIQLAGKKRMLMQEYINGESKLFQVGNVLGEADE
ncbi:methionyl-tRNA formyltransferase [Amphibacillus marinus]|uniref:Methionyl-tRNA formyltransferase n=1 Tax=Amphibacillus marinus TaxID=872970 RepID=A0A1H8HY82_9BACI|nr:methionyl-tRNA formyltransferase [Amphibacillus marinus]SEN61209.1 methionyl-tRNA formyltransferase [Amphibacillus marinus]